MTPPFSLKSPASSRSTSASRCPSVATIRTFPPSRGSKKTPFRMYRVSSVEIAKAVFRIISSRTGPGTDTRLALSSLGSFGYSSGDIPTILKCALPLWSSAY